MSLTIDLGEVLTQGQAVLRLPAITAEEFYRLAERNPELRVERNANGELVIMPPADSYSDSRNSEIVGDLIVWNRQQIEPGLVFGPSAGFTLPNGAIRSPDAAWLPFAQWEAIPECERSPFAHICPLFVVELMSPSDRLLDAQSKMEEYIANGAQLGWLIDRRNHQVFVYRPDQPVQVLDDPAEVSAARELPGFVIQMSHVF